MGQPKQGFPRLKGAWLGNIRRGAWEKNDVEENLAKGGVVGMSVVIPFAFAKMDFDISLVDDPVDEEAGVEEIRASGTIPGARKANLE